MEVVYRETGKDSHVQFSGVEGGTSHEKSGLAGN